VEHFGEALLRQYAGLVACCTLDGRPQNGPVALVFVGAKAPYGERCLSCNGTEELHGILCRRLSQLSLIRREETSSNGGISEVLPPYSTEQSITRCYNREPEIEITVGLPSLAWDAPLRPPSCADRETFATLPRLGDLKCP
jgi:hypothetical protein